MRSLGIIFVFCFTSLITIAQVNTGQWDVQSQDKLLSEGKYTMTGSFLMNNENTPHYTISSCFYAKIYQSKIIITAFQIDKGYPQDFEYSFVKIDNGKRLYTNISKTYYYLVDDRFDMVLMLLSSSLLYGSNVTEHAYYEIVKGEKCNEYNRLHGFGLNGYP